MTSEERTELFQKIKNKTLGIKEEPVKKKKKKKRERETTISLDELNK